LFPFQDATPQKNSHQGEMKQASNIQVLGPAGEIIAGMALLQLLYIYHR
jgi:dynamin GTPase